MSGEIAVIIVNAPIGWMRFFFHLPRLGNEEPCSGTAEGVVARAKFELRIST